MLWTILGQTAWWIWFVYVWVYNFWSLAFNYRKPHWTYSLMCELRWPMLISGPVKFALVDWPDSNAAVRTLLFLIDAAWMAVAWFIKDDRWKKRRKKALARVKEVAGKLVVVPVPVPVGASFQVFHVKHLPVQPKGFS